MRGRSLTFLYLFSKTQARAILEADIDRWAEIHQIPAPVRSTYEESLCYLMFNRPVFRNLFYYRVASDSGRWINLFRKLAMRFYPASSTLFIHTPKIGPGFFIQHGFSTIITARRIGKHFWVNQQVTIGYAGEDKYPIIGDNVKVSAGAKVLGEITIGDNVKIGANAVVVKNVPDNCTVVGVPAYIVRRNGKRVREELE